MPQSSQAASPQYAHRLLQFPQTVRWHCAHSEPPSSSEALQRSQAEPMYPRTSSDGSVRTRSSNSGSAWIRSPLRATA